VLDVLGAVPTAEELKITLLLPEPHAPDAGEGRPAGAPSAPAADAGRTARVEAEVPGRVVGRPHAVVHPLVHRLQLLLQEHAQRAAPARLVRGHGADFAVFVETEVSVGRLVEISDKRTR